MEFRLDVFVHNVDVTEALKSLEAKVNTMATKQDVLDAMARERQQIIDAFTANNATQDAAVQALKDQIKALQDAAAAGTAATAQDFDDLVAATDAIFNQPAPDLPPPVTVPTT